MLLQLLMIALDHARGI